MGASFHEAGSRRAGRIHGTESGKLISPGLLLTLCLAALVYVGVAVAPAARDYYLTLQIARRAADRLLRPQTSQKEIPAWIVDQMKSSEYVEMEQGDVTIEREPGEYAAVRIDLTLWITWPWVKKTTALDVTVDVEAQP